MKVGGRSVKAQPLLQLLPPIPTWLSLTLQSFWLLLLEKRAARTAWKPSNPAMPLLLVERATRLEPCGPMMLLLLGRRAARLRNPTMLLLLGQRAERLGP